LREVQELLSECPWFKVYDIAEAIHERLSLGGYFADDFKDELNRFFREEKGIGWELREADGIVFRGDR
jgi:hypothetical protein